MSDDILKRDVFDNPKQVQEFLTHPKVGFKCSYGKVRDDIKRGLLRPRRGGGFTKGEVMSYGMNTLKRKVVADSPKDDKPVGGDGFAPEAKTQAEAQLKTIQAKRAQFNFDKERGKYVQTSTIEAELGLRARAFSLGLEKFAIDNDVKIAAIFGGNESSARELCKRLGIDPEEHVPTIIDFALSRTDRFKLLWRKAVPDFLDSYATGVWFDEQMQEAWEKYEEEQDAV